MLPVFALCARALEASNAASTDSHWTLGRCPTFSLQLLGPPTTLCSYEGFDLEMYHRSLIK